VLKARKIRLARHAGRMGEMRNAYRILVGSLKERDQAENRGVDGRILLRWVLGK